MAIAAAAVSALVWLHPGVGGHDNATVPQSSAQPVVGDLAALLDQVQVVDSIPPVDGYDRGCGKGEAACSGRHGTTLSTTVAATRNRILATSLQDVTFKPGTRNCKVVSGFLDPDPYTGQRIALPDSQIDHLSVSEKWNAGAWKWDPQQRQVFANGVTELIAVSGSPNRQKSDKRLDEWLPSYQPCAYIQRYLAVAVKYQLPITLAEHKTATSTCPATPPAAA
jgi:hypothetical protein